MSFRPPRGALGELVEAARAASARRRAERRPVPLRREGGRFIRALSPERPGFPLICEVKRASPSVGAVDLSADAAMVAKTYAAAGARCVSVLTEGSRFGGSLEDLCLVRAAVELPLLRKDFIVDVNMVEEAAEAGADAVLLIAGALEPSLLQELAAAASAHGLDVLLELIWERDLEALSLLDWPLVGVNARDLETLQMDDGRFGSLAERAQSPGRLLVAESGVKTPDDIRRYRAQGAQVALVGESLMRAPDRAAAVRALRDAG